MVNEDIRNVLRGWREKFIEQGTLSVDDFKRGFDALIEAADRVELLEHGEVPIAWQGEIPVLRGRPSLRLIEGGRE